MRPLLQKGQTAVEYLLMVVVALTIGIIFKNKMQDYMVKNPNSFLNASTRGLMGQFNSERFRTFSLGRR